MTATEAIQHLPPPRHFIDGNYTESTGSTPVEVRNPATGDLLISVPDATPEDVNRAVAAARRSFEAQSWRGKDPSERERILLRVADLMDKHKEELAAIESLENGKTFREALRADVNPGIDSFRYYAGWVRRIYGETIPVDGPSSTTPFASRLASWARSCPGTTRRASLPGNSLQRSPVDARSC